MDPSILIYGSAGHPALGLIYQQLLARGRRPVIFLLQEHFPADIGIYLKVGGDAFGALLLPGGVEYPLSGFLSVLLDNYYIGAEGLTARFPSEDVTYLQTESWACLVALFHKLSRTCLVANHVTRRDYLMTRWGELCLLSRHGLRVPRTLVTSDAESLRQFYTQAEGRLICKPVSSPNAVFRPVSEGDLERLDRLKLSPVHYEEAPAGDAYRCVVVGSQVRVLPHEGSPPPPELIAGCQRVCQELELALAEFPLRLQGSQWLTTGLRRFLSPEVLADPEVMELTCSLLEEGRPQAA